MESGEIKPDNEIKLVKKGLIYYIGKLIVLPFKLLAFLFKKLKNFIKFNSEILKEKQEKKIKLKKLFRLIELNKDEEVL